MIISLRTDMISDIYSTSVIYFLVLILSFVSGKAGEICETSGCVSTAKVFENNMDTTVEPCEDFYRFACGGFLNKTQIPQDRHMWTVTSELELTVLRRIQAEFNSSDTRHKPRYFNLARNFYISCMDTETIRKNDLKSMKDRLEELGGWPVLVDTEGYWDEDEFDWMVMTRKLVGQGWAADMLFDLCLGTDARDSGKHRLELGQPELGIPREYLVQGLTDDIVQAYFDTMVEVAMEFGAPQRYAIEELSDALMFEIEIAKISLPQEEMRDHFRLHNPLTITELEQQFPYANWSQLINSWVGEHVTIGPDEVVDVVVPSFFHQLGPLIKRVDKRVVANYMLWHMVYESLPFLPQHVADIRRKLMVALTGATHFKPRWEFCLSNLIDRFEHAVGAAYVRKHFSPETKEKAIELVQFIHKEFQKLVNKVPWLCGETRSAAKKKAGNIFYHVGYPSELLDDKALDKYYEKLNMTRGDFLGNMLRGQKFDFYCAFSRLHLPVNKTAWDTHSEVTEVNAFYLSDQNAIEIPAGILQDIFYTPDRPACLNFGALGCIIAHELTHSVDDEGKQYDSEGNLKNWWNWATHREFDWRAKRIINEYSNYTVAEVNMTLKGVNVQGEVIADHGGVRVAHSAYTGWAVRHPSEARLPGLQHFSPSQLFWLSAANSWCTNERVESLRLGITVDAHPPAEFRVNGPFRHSEAFARDWNCPSGSYMNPKQKYNVW